MQRFFIFFFISTLAFAQNDYSGRAVKGMNEGIEINETIIQFMLARPCQVGLTEGCHKPLSLKDIETLKGLFKRLGDWDKETFQVLIPETDHLKGLRFEFKRGSRLSLTEAFRFNPNTLSKEKYLQIIYNPDERESRLFLRDVQITAASTLVMYDNFFKLSHVLAKAKKIRSILEYDVGPHSRVLKETFSRAMNEKLWNNTRVHLELLEKISLLNLQTSFFEQYIAQSFTASKMKDKDFVYRMKNVLFMGSILSQTQFLNFIEKIATKLSQIFGNTAGQVQFRDGKLKTKGADAKWMSALKNRLKPLDLLLEKTPFRLTDHFVPGHYGHVALWLGKPEEIMSYKVQFNGKEIPLLDHPEVFPFLEKLSQGKLVLEALREPGVTMNTLEHFMDIDDLLVLRSDELSGEGEKFLKALRQFGKPYDFSFDVETETSIVCSELIYVVYNDYAWTTNRTAGRYTVSPDHVAWKAMDNCLEPIVMFHDGQEILNFRAQKLEKLLSQRGGIGHTPTGSCYQ